MREDRLRALRAIRFASRFGFAIEPATLRGDRASRRRYLTRLSAERVQQELVKTMEQVDAARRRAPSLAGHRRTRGARARARRRERRGARDARRAAARRARSRHAPQRTSNRLAALFIDVPAAQRARRAHATCGSPSTRRTGSTALAERWHARRATRWRRAAAGRPTRRDGASLARRARPTAGRCASCAWPGARWAAARASGQDRTRRRRGARPAQADAPEPVQRPDRSWPTCGRRRRSAPRRASPPGRSMLRFSRRCSSGCSTIRHGTRLRRCSPRCRASSRRPAADRQSPVAHPSTEFSRRACYFEASSPTRPSGGGSARAATASPSARRTASTPRTSSRTPSASWTCSGPCRSCCSPAVDVPSTTCAAAAAGRARRSRCPTCATRSRGSGCCSRATAAREVSVFNSEDQLSLNPHLELFIYSKSDKWLYLLEGRGLEERTQLRPKSWKIKRQAFPAAPDLVNALAAAAERLGLTAGVTRPRDSRDGARCRDARPDPVRGRRGERQPARRARGHVAGAVERARARRDARVRGRVHDRRGAHRPAAGGARARRPDARRSSRWSATCAVHLTQHVIGAALPLRRGDASRLARR